MIDPRLAFIQSELPTIKAIAHMVYEKLPAGTADMDDLINSGVVGALSANERFDVSIGVPKSQYIKHRVRGSMLDMLRMNDPLTRDQRRKLNSVDATITILHGKLKRHPSTEEIADEMRLPIQQVDEMRSLACIKVIDGIGTTNDDGIEHDTPAPEFNLIEHLDQERKAALLREALSQLPRRHALVMRLRYVNELRMKDIGVRLGVNESRVSQIHTNAIRQLRELMPQLVSKRLMAKGAHA